MSFLDNLVAYWPLDEANGGNALDAYGDNNLTKNGSPTSVTGLISGARGFSGSSQYFYSSDNSQLSVGDIDFSFAVWVKLASKPANIMGIAGKGGGSGSANDNEWGLFWSDSADRFIFKAYDGVSSSGTATANTFGAPATGTWYFIVVEHDATANTVSIQVNDGTIDTASWSGGSWDSALDFGLGIFAGTTRCWEGSIEGAGFWKRKLTTLERTDLYNSGAGRNWAHLTGTGGNLPTFKRLGAKLSYSDVSGWMPSTGVSYKGPYFPRINENDLYRATLPLLPADRFSLLFSTDHHSGTGMIGRADFDTIEGTWVDSGAAIHVGSTGQSRETPDPVFDTENGTLIVHVHDNATTITNGSQSSQTLTTTDLQTLTHVGQTFDYGDHTGYGRYERVSAGNWRAIHGLVNQGPTHAWVFCKSTSTTGAANSWTRGNVLHSRLNQLGLPAGHTFSSEFSWFTYGGQEYILALKFDQVAAVSSEIVAIPVAADGISPIGGYYTLLKQGTGGDADAGGIRGLGQALVVDGTLYLVYSGINSSSELSVILAKANGGSALQATPSWSMRSDGTFEPQVTPTTVLDWDAVNNTIPASLSITATAGTDNSNHSAGNYYEVKTGSGSSQAIYLRTTDTFDPADYEAVECEWDILLQDSADPTLRTFSLWFVDDFSNKNGIQIAWSTASDERQAGEGFVYAANSALYNARIDALAIATSSSENLWVRNNPFRLKLRIHDYGSRVAFFVDGSCCWERDIATDGVSFGTGGFFALRMTSEGSFPQVYTRLAGVTVKSFSDTNPNPNSGGMGSGRGHRLLRP